MRFLGEFLRNLLFLIILAIFLFGFFPDQMNQIFQIYGGLFGPAAILFVIIAALPRKKRRQG